jgi:hypothetical protein
MRKIIVTMAVVVLFAAACGDDSSSLTGEPEDADAGSVDDGSADDDSADDGSEDMADGSGSDFCNFDAGIDEGMDSIDPSFSNPEEIEATFEQLMDDIDQAVDMAPDELRADVELLADGVSGLVEVLAEYDFNFLAIPESATDDPRMAALEDPAYEAASARIDAYCGFDDEPDAGETGSDDPGSEGDVDPDLGLPSDEMRDLAIQSLQAVYGWDAALAECVVDELGLEDPANQDPSLYTDPTAEVCGQSLAELFGG